MVGTLTPEQIDQLLAERQFAWLACHADDKMYVVPISYVFDKDRLVGQTTAGMKVEMMRKNASVCVGVDDIQDLTRWRSAIVWGKFEELRGLDAVEAEGLLLDKYGDVFQEMHSTARLGRNVTPPRVNGKDLPPVVYSIKITEKTGRFEEP